MFHRTRFVLVESSHPGNIGAAARALKTMGCTRLILVKPRTPRAHQHPDALAMASGAGDVLARAEMAASLDEALADVQWSVALSARARRYGAPLFTPRQAAARARSLASTVEMAFVFGNERSGLSNADIERCRARVYIPASPAYNSLNLAQAVQVLTYELRLAGAARWQSPSAHWLQMRKSNACSPTLNRHCLRWIFSIRRSRKDYCRDCAVSLRAHSSNTKKSASCAGLRKRFCRIAALRASVLRINSAIGGIQRQAGRATVNHATHCWPM